MWNKPFSFLPGLHAEEATGPGNGLGSLAICPSVCTDGPPKDQLQMHHWIPSQPIHSLLNRNSFHSFNVKIKSIQMPIPFMTSVKRNNHLKSEGPKRSIFKVCCLPVDARLNIVTSEDVSNSGSLLFLFLHVLNNCGDSWSVKGCEICYHRMNDPFVELRKNYTVHKTWSTGVQRAFKITMKQLFPSIHHSPASFNSSNFSAVNSSLSTVNSLFVLRHWVHHVTANG